MHSHSISHRKPRNSMLSPKEVAPILGLDEGTLANWRSQGKGPPFYQLEHGRIRYLESELYEWIRSQKIDYGAKEKERQMALAVSSGRSDLVRFNRLTGHKTKQTRSPKAGNGSEGTRDAGAGP